MKNLLLILAFLISGFNAHAATPARPANARGIATSSQSTATSATTGARAARQTTARATPTPATQKTVSARSAVATPAAQTTTQRGRSATPVVARAAKQSVISSGTKVATATQNTAVDEECWNKFSGCMDSFCMLDNASGGRCICSDKNAEYDSILAEIQELDNQSYQMATVGVERIEMGEDADAIMARTKAITTSIEKDAEKAKSKRQSLDLSSWNNSPIDFDTEVDDVFSLSSDGISMENKTGDALYRASAQLCGAQIPECKTETKIMQLMYQQRIRSDCAAYENSLRQQRTQSAQKLASAQSAMREAALEQYRNANKYDLGQCTLEFKKCMQTTAGCGDDFTGCVTEQTTRETLQNKDSLKMKKIKGASNTIEIAAWTYDALDAKKPLCMTVTQQCVNVKNQVWDTFLREVAPQVKSAELMAESNLRTSCISTISNCFQKACRDNIDPNNPDGSYDMCLTRPDTLKSLCKVQIDPCEAAEPKIMDYVRARLASMRVDSCTTQFKECLQSEDRCGPDYTQCIGLDTDTIVRLCPAEKLVGCQYDGTGTDGQDRIVKSDAQVYSELSNIAQGIFLNIDNNMLATCQKAVNDAMLKVCGSTENCDDLVVDNGLGARSLEYKICNYTSSSTDMTIDYKKCRTNIDQITDAELGRNSTSTVNSKTGGATYTQNAREPLAAVIDGMIYWDSVDIISSGDNYGTIDAEEYFSNVMKDPEKDALNEEQKKRISLELSALQTSIRNTINAIESDQKVWYCINGRQFQGMRKTTGTSSSGVLSRDGTAEKLGVRDGQTADVRFPQLTNQIRQLITTSALRKFRENYYAKYDELNEKMLKDYSKLAERIAEINGQNDKDNRREVARQACVEFADMSALARSAEPPKSAAGKIIAITALTAAAIAIPLTGGGSGMAIIPLIGELGLPTGGYVAAAALGTAGIGLLGNAGSGSANGEQRDAKSLLTGSKEMNQWNYKETITTTFDWENLICHKCVRATNCKETKNPVFGNKYCGTWDEPTETCNDTQF